MVVIGGLGVGFWGVALVTGWEGRDVGLWSGSGIADRVVEDMVLELIGCCL